MQGWLATGHVDALVRDAAGSLVVLEIKCPRSYKAKRISDSGCPVEYALQAGWYAMASGAVRAEVYVWDCDSWDHLKFVVPRSDTLESLMRDRAYAFSQAVITGVRPGSTGDDHFASAGNMIPVIGQRKIPASGRHHSLICEIASLTEKKSEIEDKINDLRSALMAIWPDDCKALTTGSGTMSLSAGRVSSTLDQKRLKAAHPEIDFSPYMKSAQGAPFLAYRADKKEDKD